MERLGRKPMCWTEITFEGNVFNSIILFNCHVMNDLSCLNSLKKL